jgi:hypothetical protein
VDRDSEAERTGGASRSPSRFCITGDQRVGSILRSRLLVHVRVGFGHMTPLPCRANPRPTFFFEGELWSFFPRIPQIDRSRLQLLPVFFPTWGVVQLGFGLAAC